jgi:(aminoalkyl)phosphonate N-acetyltransferase
MSWAIRSATPADAERICEINRSALGYDFPVEKTRARLSFLLAHPDHRVFVAWNDAQGTVGGYLHAADYESVYNGSMKNIMSLAVDSAYRGFGLGRMLLHAAEAWALENGCEAVRLVSGFERVNAHQFYLHCGYRLRKEEKNFIKSIGTE